MISLIDSHAHLTDARFQDDFTEVVARAQANGVNTILNVGCDLPSSRAVVVQAEQNAGFYAAVGIHPHDARTANAKVLQEVKELAAHPKVVAVGEIGLDYYYNHTPPAQQQLALRQQIRLARELALPMIIHDRDAHEDVLLALQEEKAQEVGGVMHCFSGDLDFANRCLELGFYISFAGTVTFKKAGALPQVAQQIPLERLLVETDCPYLAPVPYRGQRNEPANVLQVAVKVAELRQLELAQVADAASKNAQQLFSLDKF
ncbi:MAG TPA: TatD family hydrolase [Oscillospiraceae bacterium]|nr:TatD family hydrolase [Oscillospiraceae bacterium]